MVQTIELEIFDIDNKYGNLKDQDYLGKTEMNIGEIVSAGTTGLTKRLKAKGKTLKGSITVRAEEIQPARDFFSFKMSLTGLKTSMFGGSRHFLEICRSNEDGTFATVYRSKEQEGKSFRFNLDIGSRQLCNGDLQRTLELRWELSSNLNNDIRYLDYSNISATGTNLWDQNKALQKSSGSLAQNTVSDMERCR